MAYDYLLGRCWDEPNAAHVRSCISSHRYGGDNPPESVEAKILFNADKLDASGAMGIARTLIYKGQVGEPLYLLDGSGGIVADGGRDGGSSFMQEYNYKLKNVYNTFYTERAKAIAAERRRAAVDFYSGLFGEVSQNYAGGTARLSDVLIN